MTVANKRKGTESTNSEGHDHLIYEAGEPQAKGVDIVMLSDEMRDLI